MNVYKNALIGEITVTDIICKDEKMTRNFKFMLIFIAVLMYANVNIVAAEDVNLTLEGHFGGATRVTVVSGNYAYIGQGGDLVILDISNVSQPSELGRVRTDGAVYGINISGSYAYIADGSNGLAIINISNPSAPVFVGSCNPGYAGSMSYDVAVLGSYAYVAQDNVGLVIVNISNPANPVITSSYNTAGRAVGVAVSGNYVYVADGSNGLVILNITNPVDPVFISKYGSASDVAISGNYAYVAHDNGLSIIDINNPAIPTAIGGYSIHDGGGGIAVSGNYACVTNNPDGFVIINVSNSTAPTLVGSYDLFSVDDITISGSYVYAAASVEGLVVVNISNPVAPVFTSRYGTTASAGGIAVSSNYTYVGDYYNGLVIVNTSVPSTPIFKSNYNTLDFTRDVAVSGNYAYIGCYDGLVIVNTSNPSTPVFVGNYAMAGFYEVVVSGNYAYGARDDGVLVIINITNPFIPVFEGSYDTIGSVYDIVVSGNYAYVADYTNGFVIINISNPAVPILEGRYDTGYGALDVAILGSYAYVAAGNGGLVIIDVSNTTSPAQVGYYDTAGRHMRNIAVSGSYAYAAIDNIGLVMIDVSNPAIPTFVDCYDAYMEVHGITVLDRYVYITYTNGIMTFYTNTSDTGSPPELTIISSPNGTTVNTFNITISGTAFDESGISNVTVDGALANGTTNWNADVVLTEGINVITVVATDYFGNTNTTSIYVTYDLTPPLIKILGPIHNQIYNNNSLNLNYTVSELTISEWYSLDGGYNISLVGNTTLNNLPEGDHNVTVYANDSVGNMGLAMVNFSIDTINPTITIITPTESSKAYKSGEQKLYVNFTYDEINPKNYTIKIQNTTAIINSTTAVTTSSPVNVSFIMNATAADGYYNVTVTMWDNASNTNTSTEVNAVFMDTTPPNAPSNLIHIDDAPDDYDNDNNTDISWFAATDANSNVIYRIYRDGVLNTSTTSTEYTFTNETEGSHTYNVSAIDSIGNINTTNESLTVIVDYTKPVIHNVSLSDTSPSYGQEIIVSVNVTDAVTNITNVTAGSKELTYQSGMLWNGTITAGYGTNIVTVTAYDNASNSVTNTSLSYTGPAAPTPPSSSGGGSGGGTSGEEYENIEVKDVVREQIIIDTDVTYEFKEESNPIDTIVFTALKNSGEISATIEVLKGRSALVKSDPPGKVYQNMNIWVGKSGFATSNNIADVKVGFKVEKSWIEENDIVVSTVRLCRHHDDVWNPLPTKQSGEDDKYIYFEAKTPGFSPFSITGSTEEEMAAQDSAAGSVSSGVSDGDGTQLSSEGTDVVDGGEEWQEDEGVSTVWFVVGALVVLLVGGGTYWIYRTKNDDSGKCNRVSNIPNQR